MTRWAEAASVAFITATDVSKFVLDYICSRFGTPLEILSDRGPGFRANFLDALLENLSIKHVHSTSYYPQCNGLVEKINGVLCKIITKHVRDRPQDWDKHLTAPLWAYRTSFKVSTQFTPYHLVYGQETLLPIEVELGSLRLLARKTTSSKEKLEQMILDLQRLELDREAAIDYYITQANKKREQFNNKIKEKKLEEGMLVMRFGTPLEFVSDNGPGFRKVLLIEVCEELHILHRHSTPYYPQSNGLVEKANGIIAGIIRKMVKNKTKLWDDFLDGALWAYWTTYKEATEFTSFNLVYGQEALQPIELNIPTMRLHGKAAQRKEEEWTDRLLTLAELEWKREAAYECYKRQATQVRNKLDKEVKDKGIKEGDLVLRYDNRLDNRFDAKFETRW
ncbi:hypothetical protein L7F22_055292 [Adiantum nelumboides]|nr:hypothetical protein [Adiantum nelumboides]